MSRLTISPERPPKVGICTIAILQMRKSRLTEVCILLKVTQREDWSENADPGLCEPRCEISSLCQTTGSCPEGAYRRPVGYRNHHIRSHVLSPNCVTSDSTLFFAPHVQPSPGRVRSAAQLGNGSGSRPFNPPLAPERAQALVNTRLAQGYSPASRPTFPHPALHSLRVPDPSRHGPDGPWARKPSLAPTELGIKFKLLSQTFKGPVPIFVSNHALC